MEVNMLILIRLALAAGLFCILWQTAVPKLPLPVPGFGDPFAELGFFLLSAVLLYELNSCWRSARGDDGSDPD
jgi:hypothetical protein